MKRVFAFVFCLVFLWPLLSKTGLLIWYKANQEFIANNYCENKFNADREDCEGCCYVNKQLNKIDGETKTATPQPKAPENWNKELPTFFYTESYLFAPAIISIPIEFGQLASEALLPHEQDLIKPPCA